MEHFASITESKLYHLLKSHWVYDEFRYPQKDVILNILNRQNTLAIMPTGSGKSLCYQILSIDNKALILVVTPLIALMDDQVDQAKAKGIHAACLHSSLTRREQEHVIQNIRKHNTQLLFVSPERLQLESFVHLISTIDMSLVVVDEAHCISQWGYDFRPAYLKIKSFLESHHKLCVLGLTATAPLHVQRDIMDQLGINRNSVYISSLFRKNLNIRIQYSTAKRDVLLEYLRSNKCSIVYLRNRKHVELLCHQLQLSGIKALPYHAGLDSAIRKLNQSLWMAGTVSCMVSTNAFGMGINKPDVRYVFHYKPSSSVEDYIQEIGRAGRDGQESHCILLYNHKDINELSAALAGLGRFGLTPHKKSQKNSIRRMLGLIKRDICRYRYLLDYFDEDISADCGHCDVCMNRLKQVKWQQDFQINHFSGGIHVDHFLSQYPSTDHEQILKALNKLIDDGKMKLKGAYLEWNNSSRHKN